MTSNIFQSLEGSCIPGLNDHILKGNDTWPRGKDCFYGRQNLRNIALVLTESWSGLQVQGHPGKPVLYKNAVHCFRTMLQQEGFRSFYRGMLSSYMKV